MVLLYKSFLSVFSKKNCSETITEDFAASRNKNRINRDLKLYQCLSTFLLKLIHAASPSCKFNASCKLIQICISCIILFLNSARQMREPLTLVQKESQISQLTFSDSLKTTSLIQMM